MLHKLQWVLLTCVWFFFALEASINIATGSSSGKWPKGLFTEATEGQHVQQPKATTLTAFAKLCEKNNFA